MSRPTDDVASVRALVKGSASWHRWLVAHRVTRRQNAGSLPGRSGQPGERRWRVQSKAQS